MTDLDLTKTVRLRNGWPLISLQKIDNMSRPLVGIYQKPDKSHEVARWKLNGAWEGNSMAMGVSDRNLGMDRVQAYDDKLDEIKALVAEGLASDVPRLLKEDLPWLVAQVETLRGEKAAGQASITSLQAQLDALNQKIRDEAAAPKERSCPICGAGPMETCLGEVHMRHLEETRPTPHTAGDVNHEAREYLGPVEADVGGHSHG